jgi:WD40 repeat protein
MKTRRIVFVAAACLVVAAAIALYRQEQPLASFRGHSGIADIVLSPTRRTMAVVDLYGTIVVWDVATQTKLVTLQGTNPTFGATDTLVWKEGCTVRLWNRANGEQRVILQGANVHCLATSPDGRLLATQDSDCDAVSLWDISTREKRVTYQTAWFHFLAFRPDSKTLATAHFTRDGSIQLWDATSHRLRASFPAPDDTAGGGCPGELAFSQDGKTLASGRYGKKRGRSSFHIVLCLREGSGTFRVPIPPIGPIPVYRSGCNPHCCPGSTPGRCLARRIGSSMWRYRTPIWSCKHFAAASSAASRTAIRIGWSEP